MATPTVAGDSAAVTREVAADRGMKSYQSGRPCIKCGSDVRSTKSGECIACRSERCKAYKASNPQTAYMVKWRAENAAEMAASNAAWCAANRGRKLGTGRAWYQRNKEAQAIICKQWRAAHPDRVKELEDARDKSAHAASRRQRRKDFPVEVRANARANEAARRARSAGNGGAHTPDDVRDIYNMQRGKCASPACRVSLKRGYHVDHIKPLSLGGSNWRRNLQLLCVPCNLAKRAKDPVVWAQEAGLLI